MAAQNDNNRMEENCLRQREPILRMLGVLGRVSVVVDMLAVTVTHFLNRIKFKVLIVSSIIKTTPQSMIVIDHNQTT